MTNREIKKQLNEIFNLKKTVIIEQSDDMTVATYRKGTKTFKTGVAYCNPDDPNDFLKGAAIAMARLAGFGVFSLDTGEILNPKD